MEDDADKDGIEVDFAEVRVLLRLSEGASGSDVVARFSWLVMSLRTGPRELAPR